MSPPPHPPPKHPGRLTRRQVRQYLKGHGAFCPFCQSPQIEGTGTSNSDADWHENEVACQACGALWKDVYLLADVQVVETPPSGPCQSSPSIPRGPSGSR